MKKKGGEMKWSKCIICKSRKGNIVKHKTLDGISGVGGTVNIFYHHDCLKKVIKNPENYDDWIIFNLNSVVADLKDRQVSDMESVITTRLKYFKEISNGFQI